MSKRVVRLTEAGAQYADARGGQRARGNKGARTQLEEQREFRENHPNHVEEEDIGRAAEEYQEERRRVVRRKGRQSADLDASSDERHSAWIMKA